MIRIRMRASVHACATGMAIRKPRRDVAPPKAARRPLFRLVESSPPAAGPAAGLYFPQPPRAGRNEIAWSGPARTCLEVIELVQWTTGYRVEAMSRLSFGGWVSCRPGEAGANGLVDAGNRLVVVLR